ncbi:MAG: carbon storage regulator [Pirellulales bacterium]
MLVLSRRSGEAIHIGGKIKVTIVKAGPHRVKVGIEAPDDVQILRSELDDWSEFSCEVPSTTNSHDGHDLNSVLNALMPNGCEATCSPNGR